ncbi:MAG TPA: aldo/keto reductase [Trebonia sp.]|jgi:aryl-alcohol dehydrogenase-like predicted oxidoreductase|nr:aldo/keto reductase [Trebonia sp.]
MPLIGNSDLDAYPLSLGGNTFGWTTDEERSFAVLDAYAAVGGNFIDSADSYSAWAPGHSGGESETMIGAWVKARGNRDQVIVATKVSQHPQFRGLKAANIAAACEASLERLQADHIDLYYAHYDDASTPLEETVGAFGELQRAGKVRYVGVSNYTGARLREWIAAAQAGGWPLPVALQPQYNLVARQPYEAELAPVVAEYGLGVAPYFALAAGFLTGKYRTPEDLQGPARGQMAGRYFSPAGLAVVSAMDRVAAAHGVQLASVAIAWLLAKPGIVAPIASATSPAQLTDLITGATLKLTADEVAALDDASAPVAE